MQIYNEEQVRDILRQRCAVEKQCQVAEDLGVSGSVISLILSQERGISADVAARLGFEKRTVFVPAHSAAQGDAPAHDVASSPIDGSATHGA